MEAGSPLTWAASRNDPLHAASAAAPLARPPTLEQDCGLGTAAPNCPSREARRTLTKPFSAALSASSPTPLSCALPCPPATDYVCQNTEKASQSATDYLESQQASLLCYLRS